MISTPELNCRVHWDFSSLGEMLRGLGLWTNSGNRSMAFSPCLCPASPQAHALLLRSSVGRIGIVCGFMGPTSEARLQASLCTVWRNFVWWLVVCCQKILPQLLKPGKENTIMVPYSGPTHFSGQPELTAPSSRSPNFQFQGSLTSVSDSSEMSVGG